MSNLDLKVPMVTKIENITKFMQKFVIWHNKPRQTWFKISAQKNSIQNSDSIFIEFYPFYCTLLLVTVFNVLSRPYELLPIENHDIPQKLN